MKCFECGTEDMDIRMGVEYGKILCESCYHERGSVHKNEPEYLGYDIRQDQVDKYSLWSFVVIDPVLKNLGKAFRLINPDYKILQILDQAPKVKRVERESFNRIKPIISEPGEFYEKYKTCYHKEARAILEGKHTANKNKCVKLDGDDIK